MSESKPSSYWEAKWERMHKMPSWLGSKYDKEGYVSYCLGHYVEDKNDGRK